MTAPRGNVTVTTEVGYCPFCTRSRNLRREERRLGGLVRTTIECESCHRALSSTIGPPAAPAPEPPPAEPVVQPHPEPEPTPRPKLKATATQKAGPKPAARSQAPAAKPAARKKTSSTRKTKA